MISLSNSEQSALSDTYGNVQDFAAQPRPSFRGELTASDNEH
jgi:hypothetical protein